MGCVYVCMSCGAIQTRCNGYVCIRCMSAVTEDPDLSDEDCKEIYGYDFETESQELKYNWEI